MTYETIIPADRLAAMVSAGDPVLILDCEFDLADPGKGRRTFLAGHIPGARHVDLDADLAGTASGTNGRHPLPDPAVLAETLRRLGLDTDMQVVAYDGNNSAGAARAWWLLRWLGHRNVAVLDGGRGAWAAAGQPLDTGESAPAETGNFQSGPSLVAAPVSADAVLANIDSQAGLVIDARDPARYRGDPNPLDPVAGHIPGARNRFFRDNLDADGRFLDAAVLRDAFGGVTGGVPAMALILQCGSGVTACHNALAMEIAGLGGARLYPGSWSEWISDPSRPIATGDA